MPRPGTEIRIVDGAPPGAAALDTGTAFMFGQSERGPVTKAAKVVSAADYKSLFGSRSGGSILYDSVSTYFAEGGGNLYVSRVIGTGALAAAAAFGGLNATASSPGTWGNSLTVEAVAPTALAEVLAVDPQVVGDPIVAVVKLGGVVVERSPTLSTGQAAVDWSAKSDYVRFALGTGILPASGVTATLIGGAAGAAPGAADFTAALARFEYGFGPGQVLGPGYTTLATQQAILAHCDAMRRCALIDLPDTSDPIALGAAVDALKATPGARFASAWAPWAVYPAEVSPATVTVPYSAVAAGLISRLDSAGNPNEAAAGANGIARLALGLAKDFNDAQRQALNEKGVDMAKLVYGDVRSYGYRTIVDKTLDPNWVWFGNSRTIMAIAYECDSVGEEYVLKQIDGRGQIFSRLNKDLAGICHRYYDLGALYGATPEEAFYIDTGPGVNTIETISNGEVHAVVKVKCSPSAEWVVIEIVKVPVERPVAA
jgi:hypothetical protein